MEERLVGERGVPFHGLPAKPLVGRGPLAQAKALATLAGSALAAARGWSARSAPMSCSAPAATSRPRRCSAPGSPGGRSCCWSRTASRASPTAGCRAGRPAPASATGRRSADLKCPCWVTGVPVRAAFFRSRAELPPLAPPRLLVLGGSQGARQINEAMPAAAARLVAGVPALRILHQAGARNLEEARAAYAQAGVGAAARRGRPLPRRRRRRDGGEPPAGLARRRDHARRDLRRRPRLAARAAGDRRRGTRWTTPGCSPRPAPPR